MSNLVLPNISGASLPSLDLDDLVNVMAEDTPVVVVSDEVACDTTDGDDAVIANNAPGGEAAPSRGVFRGVPGKRWPSPNYSKLSALFNAHECSETFAQEIIDLFLKPDGLDWTLGMPKSIKDLRLAEEEALGMTGMTTMRCPIPVPRTPTGERLVTHKEINFMFHDMMKLVREIISDPVHAKYAVFHHGDIWTNDGGETFTNVRPYDADIEDGVWEQCYSELWTGTWWKEEQDKLPDKSDGVLTIIFAADETVMTLQAKKVFPVYITSGNIWSEFRQRDAGRRVLCYLPVITGIKASAALKEQVSHYRRAVIGWCMEQLVTPIVDNRHGMPFVFSPVHDPIMVHPRMVFLCGDEPGVCSTVTHSKGHQARRPCILCMMKNDSTTATGSMLELGVMRDLIGYRDILRQNHSGGLGLMLTEEQADDLSIHQLDNVMFWVPGLNPFHSPPCRMHQCEQGIFAKLKDMCIDVISTWPDHGKFIGEFDQRWTYLGTVPGMKVFRTCEGVSSLAFVTASENATISVGLPFVLRGLLRSVVRKFKDKDSMERYGLPPGSRSVKATDDMVKHEADMCDAAITYLAWRSLLGEGNLTTSDLTRLTDLGDRLQGVMNRLSVYAYGKVINKGIKFHKIIHWPFYITRFGCTRGYNTSSFEKAHVRSAKRWKGVLAYRGNSAVTKLLIKDLTDGLHSELTTTMQGQHEGGDDGCDIDPVQPSFTVGLPGQKRGRRFESVRAVMGRVEWDDELFPGSNKLLLLVLKLHTIIPSDITTIQQVRTRVGELQKWGACHVSNGDQWCRVSARTTVTYRWGSEVDSRCGILKWVVTIDDDSDATYAVLRRWKRLDRPLARELRQDPVLAHCWQYEAPPVSSTGSYDVVKLSTQSSSTTLESIMLMQPDFAKVTDITDRFSCTKYFGCEYIL